MYIYVLDIHGKPLMPTRRAGRVRRLLLDGKARIAGHAPFTVQLLYESTAFTQPVSLGIDTGSAHAGISAVTGGREVYAAEVRLRTDITELLSTRREARRTRRSKRSARYRAPRFDNRRKPQGWLPPSVEQKVRSNVRAVTDVTHFLPVTSVTVEVAQFDMQWIKDPGLTGTDYQHGEQFGFWNVREYVLFRDGHRCRCCHGKSKDSVLNVHHLESRKTGGDSPGNLVTLCETCHKAYHDGELTLDLTRTPSLRDAAAMNVMRWAVYNRLKETLDIPVRLTYGYATKCVRIAAGLVKSHVNDARCISGHATAEPCEAVWHLRCLRRNNRKVMKSNLLSGGRWKRNQAPREINGFRRYDVVLFNGNACYINSLRLRGIFSIKSFGNKLISNDISYKRLVLIRHSGRSLFYKERGLMTRFPAPAEAGSTLA